MSMTAIPFPITWGSRATLFFLLTSADYAALPRFTMAPVDIVTRLTDPSGADLTRPDIHGAMLAVLQASLVGGGMPANVALPTATTVLESGCRSYEGSRSIVLAVLAAAAAAG